MIIVLLLLSFPSNDLLGEPEPGQSIVIVNNDLLGPNPKPAVEPPVVKPAAPPANVTPKPTTTKRYAPQRRGLFGWRRK